MPGTVMPDKGAFFNRQSFHAGFVAEDAAAGNRAGRIDA